MIQKFSILFMFILSLAGSAVPARTMSYNEAAVLLEEAEQLFHEANEIFRKDAAKAYDLCQKASTRYENVLLKSQYRNGKIYYNLGNIYFKMNDLGRAILNYRKSLEYNPNDPQLLQNLQTARLQRKDQFTLPSQTKILKTVFFWHYDFTPGLRQTVFLVLFLIFWLQGIILLWYHRSWLITTISITACLMILMGGSCLITWYKQYKEIPGVIIAAETTARKGDGEAYDPSFTAPLHAGTEFILLDRRTGWSEIQLPDGQKGWVRNQDIGTTEQ